MLIVDSHCHACLPMWHEPVEALLRVMDLNGVERAIIMNMHGFGDVNNAYQQECVRRYPDRVANCVCVNEDDPKAPDILKRLVEEGACGVRMIVRDRSPGDDPLALWRMADRLKIPVSVAKVRGHKDTVLAQQLAETFPNLKLVIEHTNSTHDSADPKVTPPQWLAPLARYPNVSVKISGLGEFAKKAKPMTLPNPFQKPLPPILDELYALFGAKKMMWGSDFPPVSAREGYAGSLELVREYFAAKPESEHKLIFGEVASSIFWRA